MTQQDLTSLFAEDASHYEMFVTHGLLTAGRVLAMRLERKALLLDDDPSADGLEKDISGIIVTLQRIDNLIRRRQGAEASRSDTPAKQSLSPRSRSEGGQGGRAATPNTPTSDRPPSPGSSDGGSTRQANPVSPLPPCPPSLRERGEEFALAAERDPNSADRELANSRLEPAELAGLVEAMPKTRADLPRRELAATLQMINDLDPSILRQVDQAAGEVRPNRKQRRIAGGERRWR